MGATREETHWGLKEIYVHIRVVGLGSSVECLIFSELY